MRKLAEFNQEPQRAKDLVDTLVAQGVDSQVRGDGEVWVIEHDLMGRAGEILKVFEVHGRAAVADRAAEVRKAEARAQAGRDHNFVHVRSTWGGGEEALGIGPVTLFLIVASVLVGAYSDLGDFNTITLRNLMIEPRAHAGFLESVRDGEVWRVVTPMFIHMGIAHLLFNMMGVHRFARMVEHHHGPIVLIALVLWTEIPGSIGQYWATGPYFGGMSGVLYGVFGFVWMQARFNRRHKYVLDEATTWLMLIWFVLCVTGLAGPIANVGHAGGLIAGLIAGAPAYVVYLKGRAANPEFKEHSWASVHIRGKTRVYRQFVAPYVPLWMLAIAAAAIALER